MIRLLQGQIQNRDDRTIILFVNGVGYHVFVPNSILRDPENDVTLFIHTHLREDALTLFGFRNQNELNFFELLLTINGIGPKLAMEIMNEPLPKIQNALVSGNLLLLTSIPGIGKKIAERMVLELKGKIEPLGFAEGLPHAAQKELHPDVISALENLGYKRPHIQRVLSEIETTETEAKETEELIRLFLQRV